MSKAISLPAIIISLVLTGLLAVVAIVPQAQARPPWASAAQPGDQSIVEIAQGDDDFSVLVAAVVHAGFDGLLSGNQQLTVFAPTNDAFVKFLDGVETPAEAIGAIHDLDPEVVGDILAYHVINGRRTSQSVLAAPSYQTLSGQRLTQDELVPKLNTEMLNISASNGVVHVLNEVLVP